MRLIFWERRFVIPFDLERYKQRIRFWRLRQKIAHPHLAKEFNSGPDPTVGPGYVPDEVFQGGAAASILPCGVDTEGLVKRTCFSCDEVYDRKSATIRVPEDHPENLCPECRKGLALSMQERT